MPLGGAGFNLSGIGRRAPPLPKKRKSATIVHEVEVRVRKKEQSPMEKIAEAVANGDRDGLTAIYRQRFRSYGPSGHGSD